MKHIFKIVTPIVLLITAMLVIFKLTDCLDWSWWWVLSPVLFESAALLIIVGYLIFLLFRRVKK